MKRILGLVALVLGALVPIHASAAGEIKATDSTGLIVYATVLQSGAATMWNGSALAGISNANLVAGAIALTEQGTTGIYTGNFPPGITAAGRYVVLAYEQAGGAPAVGDTQVGVGTIDWSGTAANVPAVGDSAGKVTVGTNSDKTGYALSSGEHTAIQSDASAGFGSFTIDPPITFKQAMALAISVFTGAFSVVDNAGLHARTTTYYRVDGVTALATQVTTYTDSTFSRVLSRAKPTFSNLP